MDLVAVIEAVQDSLVPYQAGRHWAASFLQLCSSESYVAMAPIVPSQVAVQDLLADDQAGRGVPVQVEAVVRDVLGCPHYVAASAPWSDCHGMGHRLEALGVAEVSHSSSMAVAVNFATSGRAYFG